MTPVEAVEALAVRGAETMERLANRRRTAPIRNNFLEEYSGSFISKQPPAVLY